jgi:hypothetical protein
MFDNLVEIPTLGVKEPKKVLPLAGKPRDEKVSFSK